jgi:hypothetical protein
LQISKSGSNIALTWPTNSAAFSIQISPDLDPLSWDDLPASPSVSGTNFQVLIVPTNSANFFRLNR